MLEGHPAGYGTIVSEPFHYRAPLVSRFLWRPRTLLSRIVRGPGPVSLRRAERLGLASVGPHTYGDMECYLYEGPNATLTIGAYCSIGKGTTVLLGGEHNPSWISTAPLRVIYGLQGAHADGQPHTRGPVTIGNDVWIGMGVTILSGVSIGDGAIIGARTLVTSDVAPYAIVAGVPARQVRFRFDEEVRKSLLVAQWWNWSDDEVRDVVDLLSSPDLGPFFEYLERRVPG